MDDKLLPCPFCNCKKILIKEIKYGSSTDWGKIPSVDLTCENCRCRMSRINLKELFNVWNTRAMMEENK